jgi:hypothetical protein
LLNGLCVEVAQHGGITGTAGFDVASWVDMQTTPGCGTVKITHAVFTGILMPVGILVCIGHTRDQILALD